MNYLDDTNKNLDISYSDGIVIEELEYPTVINDASLGLRFKKEDGSFVFFSDKILKKSFKDDATGQLWTTDAGRLARLSEKERQDNFDKILSFQTYGFYAQAPDGTVVVYSLVYDKENILNIKWNNGERYDEKEDGSYELKPIGGCGYRSYANVSNLDIRKDLTPAGVNGSGETIYELKDKNRDTLKNLYSSRHWPDGGQIAYEDYLKTRPIIFWVDPLGRLIEIENTKFPSAAECGKPVIYLYPEKEEKVSVKVSPLGGMSVSDPEYGDGWDVIAYPGGEIKNLADGKNYPYLFWEGRGDLYQTPRNGFVIARDEVDTFFDEKLMKAGLIAQEIKDFKEFWVPKMLSENKSYYFITFSGTNYMDQLAPLDIKPKPDTVIRILMDYRGLNERIDVTPLEIRTPKRKGFTVVEWGGVLQ